MEKVQTFTFAPNRRFPYKTRIAKTREETKAILDGDTADAKIFTDGSGLEGSAGAAAVLY